MKTIKLHWKQVVLWGGVALIYLLPFFTLPIFSAAYIKFEGIDGESTDPNHNKWIEILSLSQSVTVPITGGGAGGGPARTPGVPSLSDLTVTSSISIASPRLFFLCVTGTFIPDVTIEITKNYAGVGDLTYYKVVMTDVLISGYVTGGKSSDVPTENVSLNYSKIEWTYTGFDSSGKETGSSSAGYDVGSQTPF